MVICRIVTSKFDDTTDVFGLEFFENGVSLKCVEDIFCEYEKAQALMELINSQKLEKEHIDDVIDDALAEDV